MKKVDIDKFCLASSLGVNYKLLAIDFEQTFVKGHYHNFFMEMKISGAHQWRGVHPTTLSEKINGQVTITKYWANQKLLNPLYSSEYIANKSENFLASPMIGIKNPNELTSTIKVCQAAGYKVAIVSYSLFPDAIIAACKKLKLDDITIITGFPAQNNLEEEYEPLSKVLSDIKGKQDHIHLAQVQCERNGIIPDVVLVDDSKKNIDKAESDGVMGVLVPQRYDAPGDYLEKALEILGLNVPANFHEPSSYNDNCTYVTAQIAGESLYMPPSILF